MRDALTNSLYAISTYADRDDFVNNYLDYCVFSSSEELDSNDESSPFYIKYGCLYNSKNEIIKDSSVLVEENIQKSRMGTFQNNKIKIRSDTITISNIPISIIGANTFSKYSNNLPKLLASTFDIDSFYNLTKCIISISKICYKKNRTDYSVSEICIPNDVSSPVRDPSISDANVSIKFVSSSHISISFSTETEMSSVPIENEAYYIIKFYKNGNAKAYSSKDKTNLSESCALYKPYVSTTKLTRKYTLSKVSEDNPSSYVKYGYAREVYNSNIISLPYPATKGVSYPISAEGTSYDIKYNGAQMKRAVVEYTIDISKWSSFIWLLDSQFNISYALKSSPSKFYIVPHRLLIDYSKFQYDYYYIDYDNKALKIVIYRDIYKQKIPDDPENTITFHILSMNTNSIAKLQNASLVDTVNRIYQTENDYTDNLYFPYFVSDSSLEKFVDTDMKSIMYKYPKVLLEDQCDSGITKVKELDTSNNLVYILKKPYVLFKILRRHMSFMIFKKGKLIIPDFYVIGKHSVVYDAKGNQRAMYKKYQGGQLSDRVKFNNTSDDEFIYIYILLDNIGSINVDSSLNESIQLTDPIYVVALNAFFDENVFYPTKHRIRIFDGTGYTITDNKVTISDPSSVFPGYNNSNEETFDLCTKDNTVTHYTKKDNSIYVEDADGKYIAAIMNKEYSFPYNKDLTMNNSQARIQMPDSDINADIIGEQDPITGSYFIADQYGPYGKIAKFTNTTISEYKFTYVVKSWEYDQDDIKTVTETSGGITVTYKYAKIIGYDDWYIRVDTINKSLIVRYSKTLNNVLDTPLRTVFSQYIPDTVFVNEEEYNNFLTNGGKEIARTFSEENKNISIYVPDVYCEAYNGEYAKILNSETYDIDYVEYSDSLKYSDEDIITYNDSHFALITDGYSEENARVQINNDKEIVKYKKMENDKYTVLADKTSNAYSNYNFNNINDDFLVYEIPYQLSSYGRKMIVFLNGYFTDEFIVSKKICERLFNGNSLLTFSSGIYDESKKDYYYSFVEYPYGEYVKRDGEYEIPEEYEKGETRYKKYVPNVYIATLSSYHLIATLDTVNIVSPEDTSSYENGYGSIIKLTYDKDFKENIVDKLHQYHNINIDFFSKGYTLLFINGLYIDTDHIVEIDNQTFGLKDLDYFGFETDSDGKYIIKSLYLFEYGNFNYNSLNDFYKPYAPVETESLFHGIKRYKVNSTEDAFKALETYNGDNIYCDCGKTVGSENENKTCPYCLTKAIAHSYSETSSELFDAIALADGNRFELDKLVSQPESTTVTEDVEERALYETFAKYVLNTLDIDLNLNLSYEIQSFFKKLYSEDERMPFEYYLELLERKYQY